MSQDKARKLMLRLRPSKVTEVNKPLVMIVTVVLLLLMGFILIEAFHRASSKPSQGSEVIDQNTKPIVNSIVEALPQSYTQSDAIKKFLNPEPKLTIPPQVQQELEQLRAEQASLQSRLTDLSTQKKSQPEETSPVVDVQTQQARTSGLFFPGVSPPSFRSNDEQSSSATVTSNATNNQPQQTGYDKQNMQLQKLDFLKPSASDNDIYDPHSLIKPVSPYEVQAGALIPAVLITGIDTSLPGDVVSQVLQNIYDSVTGQYLLIPKGSKLLGKYDSQVAYGQVRVLIYFYRVIRPDGSSIVLSKSTGSDLFGQAGMTGEVNNHWARVLGAATLSTVLSLGAGVASDNVGHNNTYYRSAGQNAILGAAGSISDTGQSLTDRAINIQPTLTIPAGYQFNVIVNKDMILRPFEEAPRV